MHGRSRITRNPRIPTMPGRRHVGFSPTGTHCSSQARSAVRCWAGRLAGCAASYKESLLRRTFVDMDDNVQWITFVCWCGPNDEYIRYSSIILLKIVCDCPTWVPYNDQVWYVKRSFPMCWVKVLYPAQRIKFDADRQKTNKRYPYPGWDYQTWGGSPAAG